jgi:hypothetical protein
MADTAESANMTYRLTFVGAGGVAPVAFVYPTDASAFTGPVGSFPLRPFQEMPRCPSGDIYRFDAPLAADRPVAATAPDGTRVVSAGDATVLRDEQFPLFAERGPGLLEHPELTSAATWRQADSHSPLTVAEWEHLLTRQQRTARRDIVAAVVLVAVLVTLIVIAAVAGRLGGRSAAEGVAVAADWADQRLSAPEAWRCICGHGARCERYEQLEIGGVGLDGPGSCGCGGAQVTDGDLWRW